MTNPSRPSRFGNLRALKDRGDVPPAEEGTPAPPETPAVPPTIAQEAANERQPGKVQASTPRRQRGDRAPDPSEVQGRGPGRPPGKRSDDAFRQVSALVRRDTYKAAQRRLLDEEREFSELVQALLDRWLRGDVKA